MNHINPTAIVLVLFTTSVGHLLGSWAAGLAVGSGIVLLAQAVGK